jgi:hypothetical protein
MAVEVMPTKTEEAAELRAQLRKQSEAMDTARALVGAFSDAFEGRPVPAGVLAGLELAVQAVFKEVERE